MQSNLNEEGNGSQRVRILAYLKHGKHLTSLDALKKFQCMRLASRIYDLHEAGHNIHCDKIKTPTGKLVAEYWLDPSECINT